MGIFRGWILCIVLAPVVYGQLTVRLGAERDNFVPNEPVILDVFIISEHNRAIVLGNEPGWIKFSVLNGQGFPVNTIGPVPSGKLFVLGSRKTVMKGFNLAPYFDFAEPGEYTIRANIATANWAPKRFYSDAIKIQVVRPKDLGKRSRSVASFAPGEPPEVRRYTLQTTRVRGKSHLFLRVSDNQEPAAKIYNVQPLGSMVHHARPKFDLDDEGVVHIFFQSHQRQYFYCRVSAVGKLLQRHTWLSERDRPFIHRDRQGNFKIQGGRRAPGVGDFPPPRFSRVGSGKN